MDRPELVRLRDRAKVAHDKNPATAITAHFLLKVLDAILDERQERGSVPEHGSSALTGWDL
jgi:hypothetical protein